MKTRQITRLLLMLLVLMFMQCSKDKKEPEARSDTYLDTLENTHSMKGWELYSWPEGSNWRYSLLIGTNRLKTFDEVTSNEITAVHIITVTGADSLKLVFSKFPENENIIWIGEVWLQNCWGSNFGNLQLPPQAILDDILKFCNGRRLNLQITGL